MGKDSHVHHLLNTGVYVPSSVIGRGVGLKRIVRGPRMLTVEPCLNMRGQEQSSCSPDDGKCTG